MIEEYNLENYLFQQIKKNHDDDFIELINKYHLKTLDDFKRYIKENKEVDKLINKKRKEWFNRHLPNKLFEIF